MSVVDSQDRGQNSTQSGKGALGSGLGWQFGSDASADTDAAAGTVGRADKGIAGRSQRNTGLRKPILGLTFCRAKTLSSKTSGATARISSFETFTALQPEPLPCPRSYTATLLALFGLGD
jgi:hypothetical protein